jgi:hypothetical protein
MPRRGHAENLFSQAAAINDPFRRQYFFSKVRDDFIKSFLSRSDRLACQFIGTQNGCPQPFEEMTNQTLSAGNSTSDPENNGADRFWRFSPGGNCAMIKAFFNHVIILCS